MKDELCENCKQHPSNCECCFICPQCGDRYDRDTFTGLCEECEAEDDKRRNFEEKEIEDKEL